jgi:dihydroorotase
MTRYLITGATLINEGKCCQKDVLIEKGRIVRIDSNLNHSQVDRVIEAEGLYLLPGMIDDQVHFREPGLTYKGEILTESRAAVAGGITSTMEMPNCNPPTINQEAIKAKLDRASKVSATNYAFYLGATNDNLEDVKSIAPELICGIKVFMGSSTGNMLVDQEDVLRGIFSSTPLLIATHCEDTPTIQRLENEYRKRFGGLIPPILHPKIRSAEACYKSSSLAVSLAKEFGSKLHVLHLTTAKEMALFDAGPIHSKQITAEVCVHHLWFCEKDHETLGHQIKCNPAIKTHHDRQALREALANDRLDIIATDHAPHTWDEKHQPYETAPAGLPLVQHALLSVLELADQGVLSLEKVVEKTAHNPAIRYQVSERGFIREGYWADLVLVSPHQSHLVTREGLHYKCKWSPFEGETFCHSILMTMVSGQIVYDDGQIKNEIFGRALEFKRN